MNINEKFYILDGYRGFLAIDVVLNHFSKFNNGSDFDIFYATGYYIGVNGFFILSAFLLTYRLMVDMQRASSLGIRLIRIIQYAVRRFFRIYLVFAIFLTLVCHGPDALKDLLRGSLNSWHYKSGLLLGFAGFNFLWTIAVEIKYYFIIPMICLMINQSGKYWTVLWTLLAISVVLIESFNLFQLNPGDYNIQHGHKLITRFTIFLTGSLCGIFYFHMGQKFPKMPYALKYTFGKLLTVLFVVQFFIFSKYINLKLNDDGYTYMSSAYQAIIIILLLLFVETSHPIAGLLNSHYFRKCGQYSFGIYLLHCMALHITKNKLPKLIPIAYHVYFFRFAFQQVFVSLVLTYFFAFLWFYGLEKPIMKTAYWICTKIDSLTFFQTQKISDRVNNA
jgi:peptidoglycan/LPS O-acetylase OafA/YrhL